MDNLVVKAVHVLSTLRPLAGGASARELASLTGLPRSTTQRILTTLTSTGMVIQDHTTQRYKIGPRALLIGLGYNSGLTLVTEARPQMIALRDATGETVGLSVAVDNTRVFLEEVQSTAELRFASELGRLYPLWSGANGRVLMSGLPAEQIDAVLEGRALEENVDHPLSIDQTREELERAREAGYAMAFNEAIANVNSLAMPIRDATGGVTAALSISGPAGRFTPERMREAIEPLRAACAVVSSRLGGVAPAATPR
ncbi:IclR family transcriptional regulator [Herbiconiux sp. A18JL235]|uniref:IclR family transcriptional regulator n=1 Tax=Herbiconiux sp. A18JL235 TaxID=3152363 RepID=A0AB39BHE6_9MICO